MQLRARFDAGFADWARAEYAAIGAELSPLTDEAAYARWRRAESLHDAARYAEAAEAYGASVTELLKLRATIEVVGEGSLPRDGVLIEDTRAYDG